MGRDTDLSTRANQVELADRVALMAVFQPARPTPLLDAEAGADTWRIVEVFSRSGVPFDVDLSWSSGSGTGASARVTVAKAARICLYARTLRVVATNLGSQANRVGVTVADGFTPTSNTLEAVGDVGVGVPLIAPVPPFAARFRVELADVAALPLTTVSVRDALGDIRSAVVAGSQPDSGVPIGGASVVEVTTTHPGTRARVVFTLSL